MATERAPNPSLSRGIPVQPSSGTPGHCQGQGRDAKVGGWVLDTSPCPTSTGILISPTGILIFPTGILISPPGIFSPLGSLLSPPTSSVKEDPHPALLKAFGKVQWDLGKLLHQLLPADPCPYPAGWGSGSSSSHPQGPVTPSPCDFSSQLWWPPPVSLLQLGNCILGILELGFGEWGWMGHGEESLGVQRAFHPQQRRFWGCGAWIQPWVVTWTGGKWGFPLEFLQLAGIPAISWNSDSPGG